MTRLALMLLSGTLLLGGDLTRAMDHLKAGRMPQAVAAFTELAEEGDVTAMVTVGSFHFDGRGVPQDFGKAQDWWIRAMDRSPDALSNLAILHRDGKGVPRNLGLAYDVFMMLHLRAVGTPQFQRMVDFNMQRTVSRMTVGEIRMALCLSEEEVLWLLRQRGVGRGERPKGISIKDRDWWPKGEAPVFDCSCLNGAPVEGDGLPKVQAPPQSPRLPDPPVLVPPRP